MTRLLTIGAAGWATAYACWYVAFTNTPEQNGPAWWYVGVIAAGVVAALLSLASAERRLVCLVVAMGLFAVCVVLGLLSVGLLLAPAVVLTLVAVLVRASQTPASIAEAIARAGRA